MVQGAALLTNLEVLDSRYGDGLARHIVVSDLATLSDDDLQFYIPQLVQSLKYDMHDASSCAFFLLRRAWLSPTVLGVSLYWSLVVEAACPGPHQLRYRRLVSLYMRFCG
jgi:hypothetical protein